MPITVDMAHLLHPSNLRHINDINNNNNNSCVPSSATVGIECSRQADTLVVEVRPHQPSALPTSLAEVNEGRECITYIYKVAVLAYKCQHGLAPTYLRDELRRPADNEARRRLYILPH